METVVESIDPDAPDPAVVARAAAVLRAGGIVAFPTETVYGLGADALRAESVGKIFAAKGRPANNPVIVHVNDAAEARRLSTEWPAAADRLASEFWPGPLTLVLPKSDLVPAVTTAGGQTVALRVPAHPVARALIAATGPLAAPSANLSTRVSATRAEHVLKGLAGRIEMVLDGGATPGGLESTVVDVSGGVPRLLRHGLIEVGTLRTVLEGRLEVVERHAGEADSDLASPGMLRKHYSPAVPLELADDDGGRLVAEFCREVLRVGWITCGGGESGRATSPNVVHVDLGSEPAVYGRRLYDTLHRMEAEGVGRIVVARPPASPGWEAIHDRLSRAAAK
jgi:L-threonylcarbamoyladenylate synthase